MNDLTYTRINTQVSVKHCALCQEDTEYYCYDCRLDLCIQCKKIHVIDLSTKDHEVTSYLERKKYLSKKEMPVRSQHSKEGKSIRSQDSDNYEHALLRFLPPVLLPTKECNRDDETERRRYSKRIYRLRSETIYNICALQEGLRHEVKTAHNGEDLVQYLDFRPKHEYFYDSYIRITVHGKEIIRRQIQCMLERIRRKLKTRIDDVLVDVLGDKRLLVATSMTSNLTHFFR